MNKKGAGLSGGVILLIVVAVFFAYSTNFLGLKDLVSPSPISPPGTETKCPSSGLTEVTLNAQEALASSATNANVSYYIYDDGTLVKEGDTGSDGTVSFDIGCAAGKTYKALVLNEKAQTGFYPQEFTIDATGATFTKNIQVYEFGEIQVASVVSSSDPTGGVNISGGTGKTCGFTVTFSNNESASSYEKPLILVLVNSTAVRDITMSGVTAANAKKPGRITTPGNLQFYVFEYPNDVKSTDAAVKVSGKVEFSPSASIPTHSDNNLSIIVIDQSKYRTSQYKTLSLSEGFLVGAENTENQAQVGAPDSNRQTMWYAGTYC